MRLSEEEYYQFLDIHLGMILYAGQQLQLLEQDLAVEDFRVLPIEKKLPAREALYHTPGLIQKFVAENPFGLSEEDLEIASGFQEFVAGDFFVLKYLKKHTLFLFEEVAYGVLALGTPIQSILNNQSPAYVKGVLLPFKGRIVYDGFLIGSRLHFGSGYRSSLNQTYNEAKAKYGIVTELPFHKPKEKKPDPEDLLAFYMKNAKNREYYEYEIEQLLEQHPKLEGKYYWHWGKTNSRKHKKWLKELGIRDLHYAIVYDTIIAQGESASQIKELVQAILPKNKLDWVFYFTLK